MNKDLLLRHIKGQTTEDESGQVVRWIDESPSNEEYYISLLNTCALEDLADGTVPANRMDAARREEARRKVMSGIKQAPRKKIHVIYATIAAAACILLLISIGINIRQYNRVQDISTVTALAEPVAEVERTFYTNSGVKGKIVLPDSSVVWLNSCSKITYPEQFAVNERDVKFEGEGYFEVMKNPESPMVVKTPKGMEIKVLGTKFMLKSYADDSFEEATLFSGKITVRNSADATAAKGGKVEATEMNPGESITFGVKKPTARSFNVDTVKRSAWKRGQLLFEQMKFDEVCKTLERWHGVEITVKDSSLYNYTFTADFGSESMTQILELMKFTMPITYTIKDNQVTIEKKEI